MLRVGSSCAIAIFCTAVGLLTTACSSALVSPSRDDMERAQQDVLNIERQQSVAIGLSVRNEEGQVLLEWRSRERFPLTSTVKALECARVYELGLQEQKAPIGTAKPVPHSPVLGNLPSNALITLGQACRAAN